MSLMGPWMFELINVPAEYSCDKPFILLHGDFCGEPMSGFQFFSWFAGGFIVIVVELLRGIFTGSAREFIAALSLLPLLPFFSTLLLIWKKDSHQLQTINLIAWGSACILTLIIFIFQLRDQPIRLWGLWFFLGLAATVLILEVFTLPTRRIPKV